MEYSPRVVAEAVFGVVPLSLQERRYVYSLVARAWEDKLVVPGCVANNAFDIHGLCGPVIFGTIVSCSCSSSLVLGFRRSEESGVGREEGRTERAECEAIILLL